jgi:hypothetical protein
VSQSQYFFFSGRGLNPGPCIYYALSIPTELSSRELNLNTLIAPYTLWLEKNADDTISRTLKIYMDQSNLYGIHFILKRHMFFFMATIEFCANCVWFSWLVETLTSMYVCCVIFIYFSGGGICVRCLVNVTDFWWAHVKHFSFEQYIPFWFVKKKKEAYVFFESNTICA